MSVSIALNNALTGLNINQQALTVLSQNIANANTPGYSRQIINQQAVSLDGVGEGVTIESVTRKIDEYLTKATQNQNSDVGQTGTLDDYYSKIQLLLGTPGNKDSIDSYVNSFFNTLQSLSQSPDNTTLQQGAVNSGVNVATQISQLAQGLNNLQFQADQDINSAVRAVNNDLVNLNKLNKIIAQNSVLGKSVADLQDQRDSVVKDISQYINVNSFLKKDGSLFLTSAGGISIADSNLYQFSYTPATSAALFANNGGLSALTVAPVDDNGNAIGSSVTISTSGTPSQVSTLFSSGKIAALTNLRDQILPNIGAQLDSIAATLRDQFNAVHNAGSSYPGANSLTGTRAVFASDYSQWAGSARIAVLDTNGQPVASPYLDEPYGEQPLTLDLSTMNSGNGPGNPSVQTIINAINQNFGVPQNKAELGNLNNIQLASDSNSLPNQGNTLAFDFNLNNISGSSSSFYVSNVSVQDDSGHALATASTIPVLALNPTATYTTQAGSTNVIVSAANTSNLTNGEVVYLSMPPAGPDFGGTYDSIAPASLGGYFTISNVTSTGFQIQARSNAQTGSSYDVAGQTVNPPYATAPAGGNTRTLNDGTITADLSSYPLSSYYTVTATVGVDDGSGNVATSQISYRVFNNQPAIKDSFFGAQAVTGGGTLVAPSSLKPIATAKLVDANGVELPKVNGQYVNGKPGYLQIQTSGSSSFLAIDSMNSQEQGKPNVNPAVPGTGRGFSYYFEMNNFFHSNLPTNTGDTVTRSANKLAVEQRFKTNNSLFTLGQLSIGGNSALPGAPPNYTYQLNPGDNSMVSKLAAISTKIIPFGVAGGLGATAQTLSGYIGQVIGGIATDAGNASNSSANSQALLTNYTQKVSAISGVNLDTELANTAIYQNAYAASARVITVTNALFDALLQSFQ